MDLPVPFHDEAEFVRWLRRRWPGRAPGLHLGIGDDAAVIGPTPGHDLVITTDLSVDGVHFRRDLHPPQSIGHRALARALSDLAAMGARPRFALVSLALERPVDRRWIAGFYDGLVKLARRYGVTLIGGDTAVGHEGSVLVDVVAVGEVPRGQALRRDGAAAGDRIYVTGRLGFAALGLELLKSGAHAITAAPANGASGVAIRRSALVAHLYPEPRCRAGEYLVEHKLASAAIDVSDGLARDLARLCDSSGCGALIREDRLPLPFSGRLREYRGPAISGRSTRSANAMGLEAQLALYGGEDYELIFTVPRRLISRIPRAVGRVPLHQIGEIERRPGIRIVRADGRETPLKARGFDHFAGATESAVKRKR